MTDLNRTVPFLTYSYKGSSRILVDRFDFPSDLLKPQSELLSKIEKSLSLTWLGDVISADEAIIIATEQYLSASEYIYGHPIWEDIRGGSKSSLLSYMLETRHYLAAASSRMSPCIHAGIGLDPLTLLLSQHLLEEYDHAIFFEKALMDLGCTQKLIRSARPIPSTLEWIHLTREIASRDPLSAALCSGFMEFSSRETQSIIGWHEMLVSSGLLTKEANQAIFKHVETDLGFGHDKNWEKAILCSTPITGKQFTSALNNVATISEMIYRWLTAVHQGASSAIVLSMEMDKSIETETNQFSTEVKIFNGLPVWPSSVLEIVNSGSNIEPMSATVLAHAYAFDNINIDSEFSKAANSLSTKLTAPFGKTETASDIYNVVCSWLISIDGHKLWKEMTEESPFSLVQGYMLENYHYLSAATRHISAAISSCPDSLIQLDLIKHLEDELQHCEILRLALEATIEIKNINTLRPLPTTQAFIGYLRNLGLSDWKGYVLASAFLQSSLAECRPEQRHKRFYQSVIKRLPAAKSILAPLQHHDDIDESLGHDNNALKRLSLLTQNHVISHESYERASQLPLLSWGFLDGILQHYKNGSASVIQRVGWHV